MIHILYFYLQHKFQCDGSRSNVTHDTKYRGAGESPRKSVDFLKNAKYMYEHHQREIQMVRLKYILRESLMHLKVESKAFILY